MKTQDTRKLSPDAQEALRRRVVRAVVDDGISKSQAAKTFGVSRTSVHHWLDSYREGGDKALDSRRRGRPKESRLKGHQAATVVRLIEERCPEQQKLPFVLWTREAVGDLIRRRFGIDLSV